MIRYECDRCGCKLDDRLANRFIVRIEAYAADGAVDLSRLDPQRDHREEIADIIRGLESADPDAIEDQTYRCLRFDLCPGCHADFLRRPLGR